MAIVFEQLVVGILPYCRNSCSVNRVDLGNGCVRLALQKAKYLARAAHKSVVCDCRCIVQAQGEKASKSHDLSRNFT